MINIVILFSLFLHVKALYDVQSPVITATDKTFKDEVLKFPGIAVVEFFAPWCGHCKQLTPEYEKAATLLQGIVKVVAVDATTSESLAKRFSISGFPSIKVFGNDKKNPVDYNGQRTGDAIASEAMRAANALVFQRKGGKSSSSGQSDSSSSGSKKAGSEVIELTESNFNALVLESSDHWMVEFYAPWCGHCKNLAPEWETAAKDLKGKVKFGAVDATAHNTLASTYGVKGYPSIKLFPAGKNKGKAIDYNGARESPAIKEYALSSLDKHSAPSPPTQLITSKSFYDQCEDHICVVYFLPHIYDTNSKNRNDLLTTITNINKAFRGIPLSFYWSEGTIQNDLETILDVNYVYPTVSILSMEKNVYGTMKLSWNDKNIKEFIQGVLSGKERKNPLKSTLKIVDVKQWDGKDAEPEPSADDWDV